MITSLQVSWMLKRTRLRKNSLTNQEPQKQCVLPVINGVSLLVEEVHDKFSHIFFGTILVQ